MLYKKGVRQDTDRQRIIKATMGLTFSKHFPLARHAKDIIHITQFNPRNPVG